MAPPPPSSSPPPASTAPLAASPASAAPAFAPGSDEAEAAAGEPPLPHGGLHPACFILNWIVFSNLTILFNKWIMDSAGFRYPILLTCWHLVFATIATQLLAHTTSLLDSRHALVITPRLYRRTICPIGVFYSGSLICSNLVYIHLSVAFIQILKSASPIAVLFTSWAWRVADPSLAALINVLVIVAGIALASYGEIHFSLIGFLYQLGGIIFEAIRVTMIEVMLSSKGLKMDPLVGLYYYAPICAAMNIVVAIIYEVPKFQWEHLSQYNMSVLFLNGCVAFFLNVASVFLIGKTSGLVMTLAGILKNIILIVVSVIIWHTNITMTQVVGYAIALAGLIYYSLGYDQLASGAQAFLTWTAAAVKSPLSFPTTQRIILLAVLAFCAVLTLAALQWPYSPQLRATGSIA